MKASTVSSLVVFWFLMFAASIAGLIIHMFIGWLLSAGLSLGMALVFVILFIRNRKNAIYRIEYRRGGGPWLLTSWLPEDRKDADRMLADGRTTQRINKSLEEFRITKNGLPI